MSLTIAEHVLAPAFTPNLQVSVETVASGVSVSEDELRLAICRSRYVLVPPVVCFHVDADKTSVEAYGNQDRRQ